MNADGSLHFVHPKDQPPPLSLTEAAQLGEFDGKVKYISEAFDYGIIECQQLRDLGYNDVFSKKNKIRGLQLGDDVSFAAFLNSKGDPQVRAVLTRSEDQP